MSTFEPSMTPAFQERLVARAAQLEAVLAEDASAAQALAHRAESGQEVTDFKDLAQNEADTVVHDLQHGHAIDELDAVRAALRRLAQGSYGLCQACGEGIEVARLQAMPTALRCMRCQTEAERGQ